MLSSQNQKMPTKESAPTTLLSVSSPHRNDSLSAKRDETTLIPDGAVDAIRRGFEAISQIQNKEKNETSSSSVHTTTCAAVSWVAVTDLGYADPTKLGDKSQYAFCFTCGASSKSDNTTLLKCSRCLVATYCSKSCQAADWKEGSATGKMPHRRNCAAYKRVGITMRLTNDADQQAAREQIVSKVRFYASPYAVHNMIIQGIGKGFLFMQSDCTLAQLSLPTGSNMHALLRGAPEVPRSVLLHYLTLGEYDQELCRDDFELACVRRELMYAVDGYDKETQVVYLMRFRCGHLAVGVVPLVPDYKLCLKLAKEYFGNQEQCQPLQLNIDDDE